VTLTDMPVSGALPVLVTRTSVAGEFDPFGAFSCTAVMSSEMTAVGGGVIVNDADATAVRPVLEKESVRSPGVPETDSPTNVTTPPTAATELVPPSVPPPDATDAVTDAVDVVTRFPAASRISITGCVASGLPITAPTGCVRMPSRVGAPGVTVTESDALARPAVAVILVVPVLIPVTVPPDTEATVGSSIDQETVVDTDRPLLVNADAVTVAVVPEASVSVDAGDSVTEAGVLSSGVVGPSQAAMRSAPRQARCRRRIGWLS